MRDARKVARPGYFDLWEIKGFFLYKLKRYITIIPGRKDEVYERITFYGIVELLAKIHSYLSGSMMHTNTISVIRNCIF